MTKGIKILAFLVVLAGISWGVYECKYYFSYRRDLSDRPWAYSEDKTARLLVGKWQGTFKDPDGVKKTIRIEILVPVTDEERAKKASKRSRRRSGLGSRTEKQRFDGLAVVMSKLGTEEYEIYGAVRKENEHQLNTIHFKAVDEKKQLRDNFHILSAIEGGKWQDDELTLTVAFAFTTATGSGYSSSDDPRYDQKVTIHFSRVKS